MKNSIEEYIKILENMNDGYTFKDCDMCNNYNEKTKCCDKHKCMELQAIEHLLSDYKKLQEEFKQIDHECDRLEKIDFEKDMKIKELQKENEKLKEFRRKFVDITDKELQEANEYFCTRYTFMGDELSLHINTLLKATNNSIPIQKIKDIIDRIDYDIKKTKEIISNNSNIYTSDRRNNYQIVRLRAMNTKSLDIKKRLQELLESEE
jgi:hypothetical protein